MLDAVPENAEFVMNAELLQLASTYGPKINDLRALYGFRLLLRKMNAEFKRTIGTPPEDAQSNLILWNVLDVESKRLAATEKVADMSYEEMARWIDMRYKITYGNLDYKPQT